MINNQPYTSLAMHGFHGCCCHWQPTFGTFVQSSYLTGHVLRCVQEKGISAEYYLYKDEGHGFARPPNKFDFYSRVEQFLAKHLGGRAEPLLKVESSSVVVMHEA